MIQERPNLSPAHSGAAAKRGWRARLKALSNVPPVIGMVWEAGPHVVVANLVLRVAAALIPLGLLMVTRVIIDDIVVVTSHNAPLARNFWWLVGLEFGLACLGTVFTRLIDFCDALLADKFTRYVGIRVMDHASHLDLTSYEDPAFYDKMERARVQSTDRVGMIRAAGQLVQQIITTVSLAAGIVAFFPWLLAVLALCVVPAFLGESHFAFLGYSLSFSQTTVRRHLDYLRVLGASKESAKELKLFGLAPFLVSRYTQLSDDIYEQNVMLAKRRLLLGSLLALLGTAGYYSTYVFIIYRSLIGALSIGTLTFLAGAIAGTSTNIQAVFSMFTSIADQALFLTDLLDFFAMKPVVRSKPNALLAPRPIREGFEFRNVSFAYPGTSRLVLDRLNFRLQRGERVALVGENGQGKTTIVKLLTRLYDPTAGQVLLDGVDLRDYDLDELWREIGVIFQDFMRYEMTAAENIAVGEIEHRHDLQRIRAAACKSLAEAVIHKLPQRRMQDSSPRRIQFPRAHAELRYGQRQYSRAPSSRSA